MKKYFFLLFSFFFVSTLLAQQCPPFWNDILSFKQKDSTQFPAKNAILFIGSSSFTKWTDVQDYFPGYNIINRGFGGSTLKDVIRYSYDVLLPYQPKQVIIYCGENDLASSANVQATDVVQRFKTLYGMIRQNLPHVVIDYVSMKPSPSRKHLFPKMKEANKQIKAFLQKDKKAGFINVYDAMLDATGNPKKEIFLEDQLHMNASGYAIWKKILLPYLMK
jgi:lysophospholipase L1-like esterase